MGPSWRPLGPSRHHLRQSWGALGPSRGPLGPSWRACMGRRPVDPPPPVDSSQGCTACWTFQVLVLVLFPKELPLALRPVPPATRKDLPRSSRTSNSGKNPARRLKMAQDGLQDASKTAKMASKTAKMAPRCLQDGPRCTQDGLRWPQDGPRRPKRPPRGLQDGPRGLQEVLQEGPKRPKSLIFLRFLKDFGIFACSTFRRLKTAQEAPKIAQEASKMAP